MVSPFKQIPDFWNIVDKSVINNSKIHPTVFMNNFVTQSVDISPWNFAMLHFVCVAQFFGVFGNLNQPEDR